MELGKYFRMAKLKPVTTKELEVILELWERKIGNRFNEELETIRTRILLLENQDGT